MAYKNATISLTNVILAGDKQAIPGVTPNKRIGNVSITNMPAGASFRIHFGEQDGILVKGEGAIIGAQTDEDSMRGLFFSNDVAQPGVSVEMTVAFAGA